MPILKCQTKKTLDSAFEFFFFFWIAISIILIKGGRLADCQDRKQAAANSALFSCYALFSGFFSLLRAVISWVGVGAFNVFVVLPLWDPVWVVLLLSFDWILLFFSLLQKFHSMSYWTHFPQELVTLIVKRLETQFDVLWFRFVCTSWRSSFKPKFHPSPKLILPSKTIGRHKYNDGNVTRDTFYLVRLIGSTPEGTAYPACWLVNMRDGTSDSAKVVYWSLL